MASDESPIAPSTAAERAVAALAERLPTVATGPGVYLLKDQSGKVIYVGKAVNLRARVRSYLRGGDERSQIRFLLARLHDFETLVTRSEKEALILENNLIKQYRPRYNIRLKDDKSYVSVKVTVHEPWPRVSVTRRLAKDGSRYFGPFHSASGVRGTLDLIRKIFPLRTCSDSVFRNRSRPCIEYQIKRCLGPCVLPVDPEAYRGHLRQAMALLEGRNRDVATTLREQMAAAAAEERFEDAARLRDQMAAVERTQEHQQVATHGGGDQDVFGLYREGGAVEVHILFIRGGVLASSQAYAFEGWEFPDADVLEAVLTQFYQGAERQIPDDILLPTEIADAAVRAEYLSERRGRGVTIVAPQRGEKRNLVELASANARERFASRRAAVDQGIEQVKELGARLRLRVAPHRIECVDIATFHGGETVGALVAFADGQPDKNGYRRFRIRTVTGTDDFAAVAEVLRRRFRGGATASLPDLLVIDGGLGQLGAARGVLGELDLGDLQVIGLAKDRVTPDPRGREIVRRPERVFLPGRKNPVVLRANSTALFLLQRVRDEAHRFANRYHQMLRTRRRLTSTLDGIPGIGPQRRRDLLRQFGSMKRLRAATLEELQTVPGINVALATQIRGCLARR